MEVNNPPLNLMVQKESTERIEIITRIPNNGMIAMIAIAIIVANKETIQ